MHVNKQYDLMHYNCTRNPYISIVNIQYNFSRRKKYTRKIYNKSVEIFISGIGYELPLDYECDICECDSFMENYANDREHYDNIFNNIKRAYKIKVVADKSDFFSNLNNYLCFADT